ncbi:alcohol dehydrogenase [Desertihabitans brevis]|uniref:Alcohol dehydrogenase n=1 Tax=Desertihabitans brevis TaxID=2268447 RepID=A0A367YZM9_9ACTN|nr:zinc-binding dehydrogenase [Desertihabitans brevis]RCK71320.1 alcohol dehydrogenase [Desertihabitans brevis]
MPERCWSWDLTAPRTMERGSVPDPDPAAVGRDQVLIELLLAGICGSDIPRYTGDADVPETLPAAAFPCHELVGRVLASGSDRLPVGTRVLAMSTTHTGLRQRQVLPAAHAVPLPEELPDEVAVLAQPTGTVLSALRGVGPVEGRSVCVIGLGSTGLLAASVLASQGARVTGVDPLDRGDLPARLGVAEVVRTTSDVLVADGARFDLVFEAVGHQTQTFVDACHLVGMDGRLVVFGVPDTDDYPFPLRTVFRRNVVLHTGTTQHWTRFLAAGVEHVRRHADTLAPVVTHVLGLDEVPRAYQLAASADPARVKVLIRP